MTQLAVNGPLGEGDLDNDLGPDPMRAAPRESGRVSRTWRSPSEISTVTGNLTQSPAGCTSAALTIGLGG